MYLRLFALLVALLVVKETNKFFNGAVCVVISWETVAPWVTALCLVTVAASAVHFLGHFLGPAVGHFGVLQ